MNNSFQVITDRSINESLLEKENFQLAPPFFLLVKNGEITLRGETQFQVNSNTISAFVIDQFLEISSLSADCECILIQYNRKYIRTMTLKLDLLASFKQVYSDSQYSFPLPEKDFNDLWLIANFLINQINDSKTSDLKEHILRHLNYSFLYVAIEKMNKTVAFQSKPRNQQEKLVLHFLKNVRESGISKLKVSDYAKLQNVTTRHLSTTVKQITGMSALDIIHRILFSHAKSNLTETDKPISEIAFNLGYNDPYTFSHFFKKQSGLSPTEFRNNFQG